MDVDLFCKATGADKQTAERILTAHHGDLNKAFDAYYKGVDAGKGKEKGASGPRVMTLDDLKRREAEPKGNGKQTFFAGGERSAMYVEGRDDGDGEDADYDATRRAVEGVFGKAKAQQDLDSKDRTFTGRPHKLTDDTSGIVPQPIGEPTDEEIASRVVIFWQDGLTIEDGPLLPFTEPSTQRILQQLNEEQVPLREFNLLPNQLVDIKVVHCLEHKFGEEERKRELVNVKGKGEKVERPKFSGASHKLADAESATVTESAPVSRPVLGEQLNFDPTKPSTRLQLRLSNGQRVIEQVNISVTVGQILRHMQALNPLNYTGTMMAGMPPVVVTAGPETTLEEAGLLNAVIMQK